MTASNGNGADLSERATLGACLLDERACDVALSSLRESDFYTDVHASIFSAIRAIRSANAKPDLVTVNDLLTRRKVVFSAIYLTELVDLYCPTPSNVAAYVRDVRSAAVTRNVEKICRSALNEIESGRSPIAQIVGCVVEDLDVAVNGLLGQSRTIPKKISDTLKIWSFSVENQARPVRVPTHIPTLNRCLGGGFAPGRLYYLGARPAVGKTSFALDVARHASTQGVATLVISLEMPEVDGITTRVLSQESLVSELVIRGGLFSESDYPKMVAGYGKLSPLPLWVTDRVFNISDICACAERWPFSESLGLVIVDYLQLIKGPKTESRRVEIEEISRHLKALAIKLSIPVLCISALRRKESDDAEPSMSDLKETGELEYDGDAILLLHRGFNSDSAKLILAKNKYGPVGEIGLSFNRQCVTFNQADEAL